MKFTGEFIEFEGKKFPVVDTTKIDFSYAKTGVKSKLTKVYCAKGGEKITTTNDSGEIESIVIAEKGDAIFYNSKDDVYIPADKNGSHWKFSDIENYGYSIQERGEGFVTVRSNNKALLLVGYVDKECVIKDAFGEGVHQFLYQGATIKKDIKTGNITGIDKQAFEKTWMILNDKSENL